MTTPSTGDARAEGMTCYDRDETFCEDGMCLRTGCRLRNRALAEERVVEAVARELAALDYSAGWEKIASHARDYYWDAAEKAIEAYRKAMREGE